MASIKVKFRPSAAADREGCIYYQIIHARKVHIIHTPYRILPSEWDAKHSTVSRSANAERHDQLASLRANIRADVERLSKIVRRFDQQDWPYTAADIASEYERLREDYSLFNFMEKLIRKFKTAGRERTSETYTLALRSFKRFRNGDDIMLNVITHNLIEDYETALLLRGNTPNTTSFYMRILRAAYNRAVDEEEIEDRRPFRHVFTGVAKTVKRAFPLEIISRLRTLDLSQEPRMELARDLFMLSFYLRGMSFVDMAYLRKSDLVNGRVTYRHRKTGQPLMIEWTSEMQAIVDKHPSEPTSLYLLPILNCPHERERSAYRNLGHAINHQLKKIGQRLGLAMKLTLYCARHSWASAAQTKGIPLSVIREGMGHESETTTQIYLASLDTSAIDAANALIIQSI